MDNSDLPDLATLSLSTEAVSPDYCLPSTSKADQKTKLATTPSHRATENASSDSGDEQKPPKKVVDQEKCKTSEDQNSLSRQSTFTPREETFAKRSGTTNIGTQYEDLTVASFILKLLKEKTIENFVISSNDREFGSFDDVVLEVEQNDRYAFQLKHVSNKTLSTDSLKADRGIFSIKTYFESFQKYKKKLSGHKLVLLTNARFDSNKNNVELKNENIDVKMVKTDLTPVLKTCSLADCCYKFEITNSSRETKDYETFFKNFILCPNQASLHDLKKNLQNELNENFTDDSAVWVFYSNFINQWSLQEYEVKYKLSKDIMQKVLALFMLNQFIKPVSFINDITDRIQLFQDAISKFNVTHFNNNLANKVQKIWGNLKESLNDLNEINNFNKKYQITKSYISDVETLTNEECSKLLWVMNKCPLIVEENSTTEGVIKLFPEEKFVVLRTETTEQETLKTNSVFTKLVDLKGNELFQEVLKKFQCSLAGKNINLEKLIMNNKTFLELITTDDLLEMLEKPYTIEGEEEPMIYVDRFLSQNIISNEYFENVDRKTLIVISNVPPECRIAQFSEPNFHVLETEYSQEEFDDYCTSNAKMKRFHHFRFDTRNKEFVWLKSKGDVSDLKKHVKVGHSIPETVFREEKFHLSNNIFLVSDEPGKGKSVLLKSFKNALKSSHWTVLFTSNEISEICKNSCETVDGFKNYLFNVKFKKYKELDRNILQYIYNQGKIVFMWDGLDETTSDEFNKVTELITKFLLNFTHWITARTHLTQELEDKFCVLSRSMEQFNEGQLQDYIKKRLKHIFNDDDLEKMVLKLKQYFENNNVCQFLSFPVQIYMITELFLQDDNKYSDLLNKTLSLTKLYNYFVENKIKLSYETESDKLKNVSKFNQLKIVMKEKYEKAALVAIFETKILVELGITIDEFPEFEDGDAFGFITKFDKNNQKLHFVHQSYAEYFAALYFSKRYKNISLKEILFDVRYTNIRSFFDLLLAKNSIHHISVLNKNVKSLENCEGADLNVTDIGGRNVLHLTSSWGKLYQLLKVEEKGEDCVIYTNRQPSWTFDKYDEKFLQHLLDKADHRKNDNVFEMDPLSYAENSSCLYAFCAIVAKHKIDFTVGRKTEFICNILYHLIQFRFDEELNFLSDIKYIVTENLDSLLHLAAANHCFRAFKEIIKFKKYENKINNRNRLGETALHMLCKSSVTEISMNQCLDFINFLIKCKADINAADNCNETPIHVACKKGYCEIVKLLIDSKAKIDVVDKDGKTPIHVACENDHYEIVELLINSDANINAVDDDNKTPIYVACKNGHHKIVELLINSEAKIDVVDKDGKTPIHVACENGRYEIVKLLINSEANIEAADYCGRTAIHYASLHNRYDIVELLINSGANVNAADDNKSTPIHEASLYNNHKIVKLLIESGANFNAADKDKLTPIHVASEEGHYQIVDLLIKSGADINAVDHSGKTPICVASSQGHDQIVNLLKIHAANLE